MANDSYKLEHMLISSYTYIKLKAYLKPTKDLHFDGLPKRYVNKTMTRMQGNRYLMQAFNCDTDKYASYCVDLDTWKAKRLELFSSFILSCFIEGEYMLVMSNHCSISILRNLQKIGQIEIKGKYQKCKNIKDICGRWSQKASQTVYTLDKDGSLYKIEWKYIKNMKNKKDAKDCKELVKSNVTNFYMDGRLGLATFNKDYILSLESGTKVDLRQKFDSKVKWTIMTCVSKYWIVSGDCVNTGQAIIASINKQGNVRSKLKFKLTSNGFNLGYGKNFAGIYSLQNVFTTGRRGIFLAIERDGCCHLISVHYGRLYKLKFIDSIVNLDVVKGEANRIVHCVTATGTKGEFIVGGYGWTRLVSVKLK